MMMMMKEKGKKEKSDKIVGLQYYLESSRHPRCTNGTDMVLVSP